MTLGSHLSRFRCAEIARTPPAASFGRHAHVSSLAHLGVFTMAANSRQSVHHGRGVVLAAGKMPCQDCISNPGKPSSAKGFTPGRSASGAADHAQYLTRLSRSSARGGNGFEDMSICSPIKSTMDCEPPL